jgi:hypothetical protein
MVKRNDRDVVKKVDEGLFAELEGELEALGIPAPDAARMAGHQLESTEREASSGAAERVAQHVVPVSRGWLVMRRFTLTDAELFSSLSRAEARPCDLARSARATVVIHDTNGQVKREIDFS